MYNFEGKEYNSREEWMEAIKKNSSNIKKNNQRNTKIAKKSVKKKKISRQKLVKLLLKVLLISTVATAGITKGPEIIDVVTGIVSTFGMHDRDAKKIKESSLFKNVADEIYIPEANSRGAVYIKGYQSSGGTVNTPKEISAQDAYNLIAQEVETKLNYDKETMSKEEKDITAYISNIIFEDKGYDESYIHQNNETEKKCSEILNNEILKNTKGRSSR